MALLGAFACGLIFGIGLIISGMADSEKVLGFLDVLGPWDPSLIFVMGAALIVASIGFALTRRRGRPVFESIAHWPTATGIDGKLIAGAAMFGAGWGLVGLCPGPALVNLITLSPKLWVFVACMAIGMGLRELTQRRERSTP
jgi:uncharacterized membrane protein YedE/YeeE